MSVQYAVNDRFARRGGLGYFLDASVIASSPDPKRFGEAADPWQREIVSAKIPAVNAVAGYAPDYTGPRSFLTILPRGHDKSSLEGRIASFLLAYSRARISGYIVAADKDQGRLIVDAMRDEAALNPWYEKYLDFSKYGVTGPAGQFEVVPADAASAFGFRGNVYILDEVTHWKPGVGQQVWDAIVSGREKRPGSLLIGIMNAWVKGSWQEEFLIRPAFADPREWHSFYRQGTLASWMTPERLEKVRRLLPRAVARRVLDNEPIDPVTEAGYLEPDDVVACVDSQYAPHTDRRPGYQYVLSVDYGATKDRCVLFRGHMSPEGVAETDEALVWEGKNFPSGRVPIADVDRWLEERIRKFKPAAIVIDPHQMEATLQRLELRGLPVVRFNTRGGYGNMDLAMALRNLIMTRRLRWGPLQGFIPGATDDTFVKELVSLVTKVMPYGWRLDHTSGKHDDRAVAVGMALTELVKFPYVPETKQGGEVIKTKAAPLPYDYKAPPAPIIQNPLTGR